MALMSQQLTDLRQRRAGPEKLGSEAVSEDMGPSMGVTTYAATLKSRLGDHRDRATGCKAYVRCQNAQKQPATRHPWTAMPQVGDDGRTDVRWYRHPRSLPALGANEHLAGSPVDIIQGEGCDLAGPHAELGQHHEDGVVPSPHRGRSIATIEDLLNLHHGQIGRQARELPSPDGGDTAGQSERVQPLEMEVSEKCAQRPAHRLPGPRAPIPGMALDVAGDVLLPDPPKVVGATRAYLAQESADDWQMPDDGLRRQTAFLLQIEAERLEDLAMRCERWQRRRRDRARLTKHRQ